MNNNNPICECNMGCNIRLQEKGLCPLKATSILCDREFLKHSTRIELLCSNGENEYYLIKGINAVIMHVEEGYCILVDYKIRVTGREEKDIIVDIPQELCKYKYTMQRMDGRDCVIGDRKQRISYDIIEALVGRKETYYFRLNKIHIDYINETYDERLTNNIYKLEYENWNMKNESHHVCMKITSMDNLDRLIDDIIASSYGVDEVYYDTKKEFTDRKGRIIVT